MVIHVDPPVIYVTHAWLLHDTRATLCDSRPATLT